MKLCRKQSCWQKIRHSGDYDDFVYCDKEMTDEYTPKAEAFVDKIEELLDKH